MNSTDELIVDGAALPTEPAPDSFPYPEIRTFQQEFLEWCDDPHSEPIAILEAPTGSGKTASFGDLIKQSPQPTLIIYPTNALLNQQKEVLEDMDGITPTVIDGQTLSGSGLDRTNELEQYAAPPYRHNAILTNPDILQAILQGQYIDPNDKLITSFFDNISGVIYDEFHFYDEFEISGILLQLKTFRERATFSDSTPQLVLSSATPDKQYLSFIENELNIPTRRITATPRDPSTGDQFRHQTSICRFTDSLYSYREEVAEQLLALVRNSTDVSTPSVALIFNSAKESNQFHDFVTKEYGEVNRHMKTDNGYDTNADLPRGQEDEFFILNTTSKGEVGLDFDIRALYMDAPHTAPAFIQRIGRAGRQTASEVYVYGLNDIGWGDTASYGEFTENIYRSIENPFQNTNRIRNLIGMRAATSVKQRQETGQYITDEVYNDFSSASTFHKWSQFLQNMEVSTDNAFQKPNKHTRRLLNLIGECEDALCSLRGSGETVELTYPAGATQRTTEYGLVTAIAHYEVDADSIDDPPYRLTSARDDPTEVDVVIRHFETVYSEPYYDYRYDPFDPEQLTSCIRKSNLGVVTDINSPHLTEFIQHMGPHAKSPAKIVTPQITIDVDR